MSSTGGCRLSHRNIQYMTLGVGNHKKLSESHFHSLCLNNALLTARVTLECKTLFGVFLFQLYNCILYDGSSR